MKKMQTKRGASFFTIDAMIAGMIIVAVITSIFSFYISRPETEDVQTVLNNYVLYITETKMSYFNDKNRVIYYDPNETRPDSTAIQKIAYLWDAGGLENQTKARGFIENITKRQIPPQFGIEYIYENVSIYNYSTNSYDPTINLTVNVATFYLNDSNDFIGPKLTQIRLWSQ